MNLSIYEERRKLSDLLTQDKLTGISNRRYLDFHLHNMKEEFEKFDSSFGILFFDIDHFKNVNDIHGHEIGDEILKLVSQILESNIRNEDLIGRWGGEEFIAVMKVSDKIELKNVAEKLRVLILSSPYKLDDFKKVSVTISIGGTMFKKSDDIASLISRADANMYESKETGRNKVTIK